MKTATIFKEELNNSAIWDTIVRNLDLPEDTDKIEIMIASQELPTVELSICNGNMFHTYTDDNVNVNINIRDYDISQEDAIDRNDCYEDEEGDWYQLIKLPENNDC